MADVGFLHVNGKNV